MRATISAYNQMASDLDSNAAREQLTAENAWITVSHTDSKGITTTTREPDTNARLIALNKAASYREQAAALRSEIINLAKP
jgi:hypothetical protein